MTDRMIRLSCPPLDTDRVSFVYQAIETWARSAVLAELVENSGSTIPADLSLEPLVEWLLNFSERWDFRRLQREAAAKDIGEGARWLTDDSQFTPSQRSKIEESARILGLIGVCEPTQQAYDYVLVLGGARLSCLLRPRLAAEAVKRLSTQPQAVVLLASARPVSTSERDATDTYAQDAVSEFDLMNAGAKISFNLDDEFSEERHDDSNNANRSWTIRKYKTPWRQCPIVSLSAASSEPDVRRANSVDTYDFFFAKFGVPKGSSLLLVTSQVYVPYQQLEAVRTLALPRDVTVETVGFPPDWGGKLQGMAGPTNYLQEIRSTIQAAHRFIGSYRRDL